MSYRFIKVGAILLLLLSFSIPVHAHTALTSSTPAASSIITEFPDSIQLEFNEPLLVLGENRTNYFDLVGPGGTTVEIELLPVAGAVLAANIVEKDLALGQYQVRYRIVSADGHVLKGEVSFSYQPIALEDGNESELPSNGSDQDSNQFLGMDGSVLALATLILITAMTAVTIYVRSGSRSS